MGRLRGKVALVTGAAGGIGQATASAMIAEGASVYLADIDETGAKASADKIGGTALKLDVTQEQSWTSLSELIDNDKGKLDVFVNAAGAVIISPIDKLSMGQIRRQLSVNLEGPLLGCRALQPLLAKGGSDGLPSSVVLIASVAGLVGLSDEVAYSAAKAAVGHLPKSLAVEWAQHGHAIRINAIYPGCIRTPMLEEAVNGFVREGVMDEASAWKTMADLALLKQIGNVNDIAAGAIYLASDEAKFVTGTSLVIDGGWTAT